MDRIHWFSIVSQFFPDVLVPIIWSFARQFDYMEKEISLPDTQNYKFICAQSVRISTNVVVVYSHNHQETKFCVWDRKASTQQRVVNAPSILSDWTLCGASLFCLQSGSCVTTLDLSDRKQDHVTFHMKLENPGFFTGRMIVQDHQLFFVHDKAVDVYDLKEKRRILSFPTEKIREGGIIREKIREGGIIRIDRQDIWICPYEPRLVAMDCLHGKMTRNMSLQVPDSILDFEVVWPWIWIQNLGRGLLLYHADTSGFVRELPLAKGDRVIGMTLDPDRKLCVLLQRQGQQKDQLVVCIYE